MLDPIRNNGGPTLTMAIPTGSPAVDGGNPSGCTDQNGHLLKTDQRGTEPIVTIHAYQSGSMLYLESDSGADTSRVGLQTNWAVLLSRSALTERTS
jgi:hypothetical protein